MLVSASTPQASRIATKGPAHADPGRPLDFEKPTMIKLNRAYEPASKDDGLRILVERLWPRGVSKQEAQIDLWLKDLAPSTGLRKWYGHDPAKWPQFRRRYCAELKNQGDLLTLLKYVAQERAVTFVYAASDEERNSALALKEFLERGKK